MRKDFLQDGEHTVWMSLIAAGDTTSMSTCLMVNLDWNSNVPSNVLKRYVHDTVSHVSNIVNTIDNLIY